MAFIVKKGRRYLVAVPYTDTLTLRWSNSTYDAARFNRRSVAQRVADRVGGQVVSFNPITGVIL